MYLKISPFYSIHSDNLLKKLRVALLFCIVFIFCFCSIQSRNAKTQNISVKKIECSLPPKFTNREVYSERKRKKHYVDVVSFVPFLYHIKDGEGSANTSHVKLPLPLTSIKSSGGGSALHFGATENKINQMIG